MRDRSKAAVGVVKALAMDAVEAAQSGHPGTPMALAPLAYALWTRRLRHNPADPDWPNRDRFVLSCGHASMLLYALLHLTGYALSLDDLKAFRQWGAKTPGHPEHGHAPGVETTTGPLGQGIANSVGMALAERWLADRFNRPGHEVVDHAVYALCSDGDLMEGISHEAAEIAGHQRLGKLIWIFDDNRITIEGSTSLATATDVAGRFQAYGWGTIRVPDGSDVEAVDAALKRAREDEERPTLILLRTIIADGCPNLAGSEKSHGAPLGRKEIDAAKRNFGYPSLEPFHIDPEGATAWRAARPRGEQLQREWSARYGAYRAVYPELAAELDLALKGELPTGWEASIPDLAEAPAAATRAHSGKALQGAAKAIPQLVGGSADLGGSNKTDIEGGGHLSAEEPAGRIVHFGVREHAMAAIMNGMALHGGILPFGGTFLVFSDYMRPAMRLAALMGLRVIYVLTHDSIGLGEDGPTHQPVEHLAALRAIPGLLDLRPADGPETAEAWRAAISANGPAFLSLTRQKVPRLDRPTRREGALGLRKGAYILREAPSGRLDAVLVASGSEVSLALDAQRDLNAQGISTRVVSMPSWRLFEKQEGSYRAQVLPAGVPKISIEAASTFGWDRWADAHVGVDRFGASAPAGMLYDRFGVTSEALCDKTRAVLRSGTFEETCE